MARRLVSVRALPLVGAVLVWSIRISASFTHHRAPLLALATAGTILRRPQNEAGSPLKCPGKHDSQTANGDALRHTAGALARPRTCLAVSPSRSAGDGDDDESGVPEAGAAGTREPALRGRALLCLVALLYGTLNVSLRLIYQLPDAPTAAALSTARGWLAAAGFVPLLLLGRTSGAERDDTADVPTSTSPSFSSFAIAGLELAFWNFLAQGLLNIGLLSTSSARASFLTQTSVIITPLLSRLFGQKVPPNVWVGCGLALAGLTLLSAGGGTAAALSGGLSFQSLVQFSTGDWLVLGGALSWSLYLFRLSSLGPKFDEINLQFAKTALLAVFYTTWLVGVTMAGGGGGLSATASTIAGGTTFGWLMHGTTAGLILLFSALGPGTIADVLQQQGQRQVTASEANVILSMEPVFTALCAWVVLGELTSAQEAVGGGMILAAALVATR